MNGGPFRAPQSQERRSTSSRQEAVRRPSQASKQEIEEEIAPVHRTTSPRAVPVEKSPMRFAVPLIIGVVLLVVGLLGGWFASAQMNGGGVPSVNAERYQAVFLTNGQVYFGKLAHGGVNYSTLTDVYYLQGQQQAQDVLAESSEDGESRRGDTQLIKLGEEIHGPEDEMIINEDQILFVENLKQDSTVVRTIEEYKNSQR